MYRPAPGDEFDGGPQRRRVHVVERHDVGLAAIEHLVEF